MSAFCPQRLAPLVFSFESHCDAVVKHGCAGGNYPLLGGKYANWQGGVSVPAIVSGGYLPAAVRGTVNNGEALLRSCVFAWRVMVATTLCPTSSCGPRCRFCAHCGLVRHAAGSGWR